MTTQKETSASGGNHSADVNTQNKQILNVLAMLERIAIALEKGNTIAASQAESLKGIRSAAYSLTDA